MVTVDPAWPAYAEYFAQSPLSPVVVGPPAVVFDVVLLPPDEQATKMVASTGAAKAATVRGRFL